MARRVKFIIFFLFLFLVVSPLSSEAGLGPPHNIAKCSDCHAGGFAEGLFSVTPNCLNCHGSGKLAASRPFAENDASRLLNYSSSGTGQNISHAWGVTVNEPRAGSSYPSDILGTYVSKVTRSVQKVSCPSCHAVHYRVYPKMLRGPYESLDYTAYGIGILYGVNQLCLECHSARNQTHHTGHSHPVRVQLPDDQARFNYPPYLDPAFAHVSSSILKLYSTPGGPDTVMCLTCHGIHMTDSNPYTFDRFTTYSSAMENLSTGDGFLLRQYNDSTLCRNCHDYQFHNAMVCRNCHDPHSVGDNYYLIMNNISTPTIGGNSYGNISVSLTNLSSGFVLFNDTGPRGVCETCHRLSTDSPSGALFQGWSSAHAALGINKSDAPNYNCLECHNHKVGTGTKSFAGCNGCHGTPPNSNVAGGPDGYASFAGNSYLNDGPFLDESQTPHRKHAIDYPFGNQGAGYGTAGQCRACHSNDKSLHMNTVYQNVNFGLHSTTGDGRNYNTGTRQCSNVYCHSNSGPWDGASYTAPTYRPPTWGAPGTLPGAWQCEGCHDWPPPTNKHPTHADGDYATKPYSFDCANCHDATVDNYSTIADTSYHVNKEKNVIFGHIAKTGGANPFYNATTHRCSNVYCHGNFPYGNNTTVQWDSESPCGSCHDVPNTATSHDRHVTDYNFDCANCHEATMDVSSSDISGYDVHVDGEKTVEFGIARDGVIDNRDGISTTGPRKCDNIYCHSRGTDFDAPFDTITSEPNSQATWAAAISCNYCHGNTVYSDWRKAMPNYTTGNPKGNSHQTHVINNGVECYTCHSVTLANSSTIGSTVTHVNKAYNIDLVAKYDVGDPNYNAGTHTCDNASCHGGNITPAWGNTIECENCHGNDHDVDNYAQWTNFTGVVAQIYTSDFKVRGHGRTSGNYDITENVGANRVCKDCHDQTAPHGGADKPFRTKWSGDLDTFCLSCHGSGAQLQGAFSSMTGIKSHSFAGMSEANGYQNHTSWRITPKCIDCHDPHGDGNVAMIHDKVHSGGSDAKGRRNAFFNKSTVVFLNHSNSNSFANSSDTSICQACHTKTAHFRQEGFGGASDQLHMNVGGTAGKRCTPTCHNHRGGFAHGVKGGSGGAGGTGCVACHGHEKGTLYDADMQLPVTFGVLSSLGAGTTTPHSTHTEFDADDQRGPKIYCSTCHDINNIPYFNAGVDANGDGRFNLAETTVCDDCHSPGGTYNGVDTVKGSIGAKDNWHTGGVYNVDGSLKIGKEKWCAGCHDESPSVISSVSAPKVIGDESTETNYGVGYGFYKTGHGVPTTQTMPASGGITDGPGKNCPDCHDTTVSHIDGNARTYDCASGTGGACSNDYQSGYRLKSVDGSVPMEMPYTGVNYASFRLCFSCHTNSDAWLTNNRTGTNFYNEGSAINRHNWHLIWSQNAEIDWDGANEANMSCITCHNVHGSKNPAMIRSGELVGWPSLTVRYGNAGSTHTAGQEEPVPNDITLANSTKITMLGNLASPYCSHCHGTGTAIISVSRTPANLTPKPPVLDWVAIPGYEADGVEPDAGVSGSKFNFRVEYSDVNQDGPPTVMQLWIDIDNNGDYDGTGEKIDMDSAFAELDPYTPYSVGVDYVTEVLIDKTTASGNTIKYRFFAQYSAVDMNDTATGPPTYDSTLSVLNKAPVLEWTGEADYVNDGVDPEYGPKDGSYIFRIKYIDDDDGTTSCPTSGSSDIQVWVDTNENSIYDAGEKFNLLEVSGSDTDCTSNGSGKLYYLDQSLPNSGGVDKTYNYRFYAYDGNDEATGAPVLSGGAVTVAGTTNNPPFLEWNSGACQPEGAKPPRSALSSTVDFSVIYYDEDNQCPTGGTSDIQVYVDLDNSGTYSGGEMINLNEETPGDTDCTVAGGGKVYTTTVVPTTAANGITYEFHATDGTDAALGEPATTGSTIDVVNANAVVKKDGTEDYTTISAAISANGNGSTILVYDGTYNENLNITADPMTLVSACGATETIVSSSNNPVVHFNFSVGGVLDGFTVAGGSGNGIYSNGTNWDGTQSTPTIKNSIIRNNSGRGVSGYASNMTIIDSEIYENSGGGILSYSTAISNTIIRNNSVTGNGGGIASETNGGSFSLTNVVIKDNTATGSGGGIYCDVNSSYAPTWEKLVLSGNSAANGGGAYFTQCNPTIKNSLISDNSASYGGGLHLSSWTGTKLLSSTIVNNTATTAGGAVHSPMDVPQFENCILWGNRSGGTGHIGSFTRSSNGNVNINLYDSIVENNGDNNITDDNYFVTGLTAHMVDSGTNFDAYPNFVNYTTKGDYHLNLPSQAIDNAGNTSGWGIPTDDLDGNSRPGGGEDIGAYEYQATAGNNVPVLTWTGQTDYVSDGVNPDSGDGGANYEFRVDYSHADNVAPDPIEVWVDQNGNGAYEVNEKYAMTNLSSGDSYDDGNYINGERYVRIVPVYKDGGGEVNYRFYASDGQDIATDAPTVTSTLYVNNMAPTLSWVGDANFIVDGVNPDIGQTGSNFTFRVLYTDTDNLTGNAPPTADLYVDLNNDEAYDPATEKFTLSPEAGADAYHDGDYSNGEVFVASPVVLNYVGDGILNYTFYFVDLLEPATGAPTSDKTVTVTLGAPGISGTVYTDEGVTPIADGATVRLVVNGTSVGTATTSGGAYTVNATTTAGDNVIVYIDGHTVDGTTVTVAGGSSISGLDIYGNRLITRNDNGGNLTNALMNAAKVAYSDTEILYSVSGGNLAVSGTDTELFVPVGYTFAPGGSVTTVHVDVNGTLNDGGNMINVAGNWDVAGTGAFTASGTVVFNAATGAKIITPGGVDGNHDFQNIVFNDSAGTAIFQLAGDILAIGDFTVTNGMVDTTISDYDITVGGNYSQAAGAQVNAHGSIITVTGNFNADGSADDVDPVTYPASVVSTYYNNATIDMAGTASTLTYLNVNSNWVNGVNNLNVGHSGATDTVVGNLAVRGVLTVGSGGVAGSSIMYIRGDVDPMVFDPAANVSVGSLRFNGLAQNLPALPNGYDTSLYLIRHNLVMTQTGNITLNSGHSLFINGNNSVGNVVTYNTDGYNLTVGNDLNIGGTGTDTGLKKLNGTNSQITVGGDFNLTAGTTEFTYTGSSVTLSGGNQAITGSVTFNNLSKTVSSAATLSFEAGQTITVASGGSITLKGASGQLLTLTSSTGSSEWNLSVGATASKDISYVDVSWSNASSSDVTQKPVNAFSSNDGGSNTDWFFPANNVPNTPTNSTPTDGATNVSLTPTLTASAFSDPDVGDTHQASQWQVSTGTGGGFDAGIVHNSGVTGTDLTSHDVSTTLSYSTVYYWRVRYQDNNGAWSSYSTETDFTTMSSNVPPNTPTNSAPAGSATDISRIPTLTASAFSDPNVGDTHLASQWQISTNSGFTGIVYDSGPITDLTSHVVTSTLDMNTTYYWHVRYQDNNGAWSSYSVGTSFTTTGVPDGAVLYWRFDNGSGSTAYDSSASGYDGTITDATWTGNGAIRNALSFDGNADRVSTAALTWTPTAFSVEFWLYPLNCTSWNQSIAAGGGWSNAFTFHTDNNCGVYVGVSTGGRFDLANGTVNRNAWNHFVYTIDASGNAKFYKNGTEIATGSHGTTRWGWGGFNAGNSGTGTINGTLDEVVVYNKSLSPAEVTARYNEATDKLSTSAPSKPVNSTPTNGATAVSVTPTMTASAFSDSDTGDTHLASRWQLRKSAGSYGDADSHDSGPITTALTSWTLNNTGTPAWPGAMTSWSYRRPVNLSQTTPAANYMVTLNLTPENFDYLRAKSDGGDIRFYEADGTLLSYKLLTWNSLGDSTVAVQVATSGTSIIYMYYGNSGATDAGDATLASIEPEDIDFEESADFTGIWEQKSSNTNPGWTVGVDVHEGPNHYVDISGDTNAYLGHIYIGQEFKVPANLTAASFSTDYQSYCSGTGGGWVHVIIVEDSVWQSGITGDFRTNITSVWQGAIKENTNDVTTWTNGVASPRSGYSDLVSTLNTWTASNPGGKLWAVVVWTGWHNANIEWGKIDNFKLAYTSSSDPKISGSPQAAQQNPVSNLGNGTEYFWRVQYGDSTGTWSPWSDETSFTTAP